MFNPVVFSLKYQQAVLEGTMNAFRVMMDCYLHLLEQQRHMMEEHLNPHRRAEDIHVRPKIIPGGPDLENHYGHRSHDVDVEHI